MAPRRRRFASSPFAHSLRRASGRSVSAIAMASAVATMNAAAWSAFWPDESMRGTDASAVTRSRAALKSLEVSASLTGACSTARFSQKPVASGGSGRVAKSPSPRCASGPQTRSRALPSASFFSSEVARAHGRNPT